MVQPDREYGACRYLNTVPASATTSIGGRRFCLRANYGSTQKCEANENQDTKTRRAAQQHEAVCSSHKIAAIPLCQQAVSWSSIAPGPRR